MPHVCTFYSYERRCWITFDYSTNIKDAIARITANQIKDQTLECSVNRELPRRIKPVTSRACYVKRGVINDIKLAKKLIEFYDNKADLWKSAVVDEESGDDSPRQVVNPVLLDVHSLLEDVGDGDDTGEVDDKMEDEEEGAIGRNPADSKEADMEMLNALDMMLWYLRIVHSVDFYGNSSVPTEDMMPHRCGIITVRNNRTTPVTLPHNNDEVDEYLVYMEKNLEILMKEPSFLSDEEISKLGKRDYDIELEKFVQKNTEKISEEKYLCPLSGKKFKAPDYVRKHIFNKHMDKVEATKLLEVDTFNNYLKDPERPMPDTISGSVPMPTGLGGRIGGGMGHSQDMMNWGQPPPGMMMGQSMYQQYPMSTGRSNRPPGRGGRNRGRGRSTISYKDLDNPADMDY